MPKVSKIRAKGNGYTGTSTPKRTTNVYTCTRCGREHGKQKGLFPSSFSPLFANNNGYVPICSVCIDDLFEQYKGRMPTEESAMRRICMICDMYWNQSLFESVKSKDTQGLSIVRTYISKLNLPKYNGKTFDDTIDEERLAEENIVVSDKSRKAKEPEEMPQTKDDAQAVVLPGTAPKPSAETILFWGSGLTPEIYQELNLRYQRWTRNLTKPLDDGTEGLYKQLCMSEVSIIQNMAAGKSIEAGQKIVNDIMSKLNITPEQQAGDEDALGIESIPMGVWIRRWEDKRPLPEEDDDMKDKNNIIRYIHTWFFGHIGKMLGIKNIYTRMYDEEMEKYRIERPDLADENDDDFIIDLFGETSDGDE